ncbi:hypothetical protein BH23PLA1_BH23PLA1_11210 [soil metagenome]
MSDRIPADWEPPEDEDNDPIQGWELRYESLRSRLSPGSSIGRPAASSIGFPRPPTAIPCPADSLDEAFSLHLGSAGPDLASLHSSAPRVPPRPPSFPATGIEMAGFRLLRELGRGAFARVYLAEEVRLADRLVAVKVTQAIGEEPQMLARLQHAHIVPIHSVHEEPETGLRFLCMPYLGGANLAQVLEAAGQRLPTQAQGASLLEALDEIGGRVPVEAWTVSRRPRPGLEGRNDDDADAHPAGDPPVPPSTVRSILGHYWARMAAWNRDERSEGCVVDPEQDSGQPARRFLRGATSIQAAVWIAARLAEGLEHAHSRGLLHRDLKPSNILITADGTPMILDFNLSTEASFDTPEDVARAQLGGTLPYMAPEHLDAFNPRGTTPASAVDERADLYSLGLILFEMIVGHHPFADPPDGLPMVDSLTRMTEDRRVGAPSARASNPQVPWSLDALLRKALDPDPRRRYQSAGELAEDMRCVLDDLPLCHAGEPSWRERWAKWVRRHPKTTGSTTVAIFAAVLLIAFAGFLHLLMQNLEAAGARLHRKDFENTFAHCQFLLNTTSDPLDLEALEQGVQLASRALDAYGIDQEQGRDRDWTDGPLVRHLNFEEQKSLREELAELLLLKARARVLLARSETESQRAEALRRAINRLDLAERIDPYPSSALYADRASYYAALGLAEEAEADRERADQLPPASARDFNLLGTRLLAVGRLDEAEVMLSKAVAREPRRFWAWFALGLCHMDMKRYSEAAHDFSICTLIQGDFAWAHANRGLALARSGRLNEAMAAYDRALQLNPNLVQALVNRSLVSLELGDSAAAAHDLQQAIRLGQADPDTLAAWGETMARDGRQAEAERAFADAMRRRPDFPPLLVARGITRLRYDVAGALADLERALQLDPREPRAHLGLAHLRQADHPRAALGHLDRALDIAPSFSDARQFRAVLRARLGDRAALDDVQRLEAAPTPHGLYNAACALAILSRETDEPRHVPESLRLLQRALEAGFPVEHARADQDLAPLRHRNEFRDLLRH